MKVLFINHIPDHFIKDRDPIGIMYLSAVLKKAGHNVMLCSARIKDIENALSYFPAEIVAYSITTGYHNLYLKLNDELRERHPNLISIFGGPHATFMPDFIEENINIDAVCIGEGDLSIVDLVNRIETKQDYHLTPNFLVRYNNKIYRNPIQNLVEDLDTLPFPDREIVYDSFPLAKNSKIKNFMTMRGCPYTCSYCFNCKYNELYKGKGTILRRRSVENVINEICLVKKQYPLGFVVFIDDTFILFPEWVEQFCHEYKRRVAIPFMCYVRLDLITDNITASLKKAGCFSMDMGIESGNDDIREKILKRKMSREKIVEGTRILRSHGIRIMTENLIGIPGSSLENDLETYVLNKECKVYYPCSTMLQPYQGTDIHEYANSLNLMKKNIKEINPEAYLRGESQLEIDKKPQRERLNKILAIASRLRLPVWSVKLLISLPLKPFYALIHVVFKGYCGAKLYPCKYSISEKIKIFFQLFKQHHYDSLIPFRKK